MDLALRDRKSRAELPTLSAQMIGFLSQARSVQFMSVSEVRTVGPRMIYESQTYRMA